MSDGDPPAGPFHYTGPEGFEAWGYRFPSGFLILEWIPESVPEDEQTIYNGPQSVYHSFADFRATCTGEIDWGRTPLEDDHAQIEISERQRERFDQIREACKNEHIPAPSDESMFKSLMDEWERDMLAPERDSE
ncbi:hypothetical protein [Natrinema gari]|uniref:Uncharacterized protein n=1 Tax=Natrinema gari JCM 14663 TaxID=1230459 RepID=L9ZGF9_9EURY|nr:hypothetical protein [Natrinema gari]ELY85424.1 hypothetical protein C486_00095 [Natrinema gari JCM 14663]